MGNLFLCVHGHFYQPPRENPWLEQIELEDSSAPYHDWNERICAECYGPNAHARIVEGSGRVKRMINNYAWMSFNFGPTLLTWLERHAPRVLAAIQEADRISRERCDGHGNAIAQAYNHTILPLSSLRDKRLQVEWGVEAFLHYFRREPEGMWLPETGVDTETLETLAEFGIRFTILSPRQARRIRPPQLGHWIDVNTQTLDVRRPYRCRLPSGREIAIFFYNGEIAQEVAFQRLLTSGERFLERMLSCLDPNSPEPQLVHVATDGETYGHHHRFGEMALAYLISRVEKDPRVQMTNYGAFLERFPPVWEVEIHEKSSWSCAHGVERWRSDCGCRLGGPGTQQKWRQPLREGLETLKKRIDWILETEGRKILRDPWEAFRKYIRVVLARDEHKVRVFLEQECLQGLSEEQMTLALKLLEMERHGQLMFTSCAWFFDDLSGLEGVQILRLAARAIQLAEPYGGASLEGELLQALERAPSNFPQVGDGRRLWIREVRPSVTDLERVLAHFAVSSVFRRDQPAQVGVAYSLRNLDFSVREAGSAHLAVGAAEVASRITLEKCTDMYAVIHFEGLDVQFFSRPWSEMAEYESIKKDLFKTFHEGSLGDVYQGLLESFQRPTHRLKDLFRDEQRRIIQTVLRGRIADYQALGEQLFEQDSVLLRRLGALQYPIPEPMRVVAQFCTENRMRTLLDRMQGDEELGSLAALMEEARQWGYRLDVERWERYLLLSLEQRVEGLRTTDRILTELRRAQRLLKVAEILGLPMNLWNVQNVFIEVCRERLAVFEAFKEEIQAFASSINLTSEVLPLSLR